jgi:hypothetical protein
MFPRDREPGLENDDRDKAMDDENSMATLKKHNGGGQRNRQGGGEGAKHSGGSGHPSGHTTGTEGHSGTKGSTPSSRKHK